MQQVASFMSGERDYTLIKGDTGPLVYPALHVWIYRGLYGLTYEGRSIVLAEVIFALLYCFNLLLVMGCYRQARVCSQDLQSRILLRFQDTAVHLSASHSEQAAS